MWKQFQKFNFYQIVSTSQDVFSEKQRDIMKVVNILFIYSFIFKFLCPPIPLFRAIYNSTYLWLPANAHASLDT